MILGENYLLVINAGSSSIKFAVYQIASNNQLIEDCRGHLEGIGSTPAFKAMRPNGDLLANQILAHGSYLTHKAGLEIVVSWLMEYLRKGRLLATGHRVVHGGVNYAAPVLINTEVLSDLEKLIPLAPLHQPHNLASIRALQGLLPGLPQVACFDTAFHQSQPEIAQYTGLPKRFFEVGIRRYGFHGLSFEYVASVLSSFSDELVNARVIIAHLGNGASLCAVRNGCSIATTMGFSPLDGLLMGTRCGSLDPGIMLYLLRNEGLQVDELENLLYHESGLFGVSGISSDIRPLLASNELAAKIAIELFVYRIGREIGSMAAALGGLDALVFTGGIGENSSAIRALVCQQAAWLGIEISQELNAFSSSIISTQSSEVSVLVIPTNENLMIAQQAWQLLKNNST
ncbi:acetate kinase [biofilm metagenome]